MLGEWSHNLNAFWYGADGAEYIAFKGSNQIFVYPCDDYPNPPTEIWHYGERIETIKQFTDALDKSKKYKVKYEEINTGCISNDRISRKK